LVFIKIQIPRWHFLPRKIAAIKLNHQNQFCLSPNFNECKVYKEKGKTSDKKYPGIFTKEKSRLAKILPKLIVASILLLVIGFVLFQLGSKGKLSLLNQLISPRSSSLPAWTEPTANIEIIPTDSATATATHAPVKSTPTPKQTPPKFIETPMGKFKMFIVHRVLPGESLRSLSEFYKTSPEAIVAINYGMGKTLWVDTLVVIPFERINMTGVPPLTAYLVEVNGVSIERLAEDMFVDPALLRELNDLPAGYRLTIKEAIVIPHSSPQVTPGG
jgi:hypothetical protein